MEIEIERKWLVTGEQYREFVNWLSYRDSDTTGMNIYQRYFKKNEIAFIDGSFYINSRVKAHRGYLIKAPKDCPDLTGVNLRKLGARMRRTVHEDSSESLEFTIKLPHGDGISKREINIPLEYGYTDLIVDAIEKDDKLNHNTTEVTPTGLIKKVRWSGEVDDVHYDADRFTNRPFYIIEAEFNNEEDADAFVAPFEFIREVTEDKRFSNKRMAWNHDVADGLVNNIRMYIEQLEKEANALRGDTLVSMRESVTNEIMAERYEKIARDLKHIVGA
ncbi:hypothetical protein [Vibrio phage VH7D]|uniref:Uncharacterized protein n=1 Tax=Vibrio phage VH7D TaxID=1262539 RepID=V9LYV5_9CAUD|nr:hypothetical protein CF80_gp137 [Vibrio phage VH7D]AGB06924.1 hypothetical protein [Vibrio phage VH7D]